MTLGARQRSFDGGDKAGRHHREECHDKESPSPLSAFNDFNIPPPLLLLSTTWLHVGDLLALGKVDRSFRDLTKEDVLWKAAARLLWRSALLDGQDLLVEGASNIGLHTRAPGESVSAECTVADEVMRGREYRRRCSLVALHAVCVMLGDRCNRYVHCEGQVCFSAVATVIALPPLFETQRLQTAICSGGTRSSRLRVITLLTQLTEPFEYIGIERHAQLKEISDAV